MRTLRSFAPLALLLACTPTPPPAPETPPPSEPNPPATPEPLPPAPEPAPPPIELPPRPTRPSAPPDAEFQLAAYRDGSLSVHVLGDTPFVLGAIDIAHLATDDTRLVRDGDDLATLAEPARDLGDWEILAFGGTSPSAPWIVTQHRYTRTHSRPAVQRREGDRWLQLDNVDRDLFWYYTDIVEFDGRLLGLRMTAIGPDEEELAPTRTRYRQLAAARRQLATTRPRFDVLGAQPTPSPLKIARDLAPITAAVAPTGELFLLGRRGGNDSEGDDYHPGTPILQRWEPGGKPTGTESKLPIEERCALLAVRSATEAHVACNFESTLLHFDGKAWSSEHVPEDKYPLDLAVAPEGALWLVLDPSFLGMHNERPNEVWRRLPGAAWERVALPELNFPDRAHPEWLYHADEQRYELSPPDAEAATVTWPVSPLRVLPRAGGDVWLTGYVRMFRDGFGSFPTLRDVVLRNRPMTEALRLRPDSELLLESLDRRPAKPWTPAGCPGDQPAFVTLRTLPPDTPQGQPEPAVEALVRDPAALAGVTGIFEVLRNGRRTIGLFARPADQPAADALLAALARLVPDEPHTLECRQPNLRREFDRTTGQPLQSPVL